MSTKEQMRAAASLERVIAAADWVGAMNPSEVKSLGHPPIHAFEPNSPHYLESTGSPRLSLLLPSSSRRENATIPSTPRTNAPQW